MRDETYENIVIFRRSTGIDVTVVYGYVSEVRQYALALPGFGDPESSYNSPRLSARHPLSLSKCSKTGNSPSLFLLRLSNLLERVTGWGTY